MSVFSPAAMAGQPSACAFVGARKDVSNQAVVAAENKPITTAPTVAVRCDSLVGGWADYLVGPQPSLLIWSHLIWWRRR